MLPLALRRGSAAVRLPALQSLYPPLHLLRRSTSSILPDAAAADDADATIPTVRMYKSNELDAVATPSVHILQSADTDVPIAEYLEGGQLSIDSIPTRMVEIPCPFSHSGPRQYETVKVGVDKSFVFGIEGFGGTAAILYHNNQAIHLISVIFCS